jgi:hypothetical protein
MKMPNNCQFWTLYGGNGQWSCPTYKDLDFEIEEIDKTDDIPSDYPVFDGNPLNSGSDYSVFDENTLISGSIIGLIIALVILCIFFLIFETMR